MTKFFLLNKGLFHVFEVGPTISRCLLGYKASGPGKPAEFRWILNLVRFYFLTAVLYGRVARSPYGDELNIEPQDRYQECEDVGSVRIFHDWMDFFKISHTFFSHSVHHSSIYDKTHRAFKISPLLMFILMVCPGVQSL
jgi:hypothetical protein